MFDRFRNLTTSSPARFAVLVFVSLILALHRRCSRCPPRRRRADGAPLADAVFTAVSTICVTGLSTVDVATFFSPFGKFVIWLGVNIGGMGVLTLASILGLVISKRLGLRAKLIAASDTNPLRAHGGPVNEGQTVRLGEVGQLLRTVALSTLLIEALVAVALFPSLILAGIDPLDALWEAPFYAAMAFTNTGFTPNPGGLVPFADDYILLTILMVGVFLGSIGFPVIYTLWKHLVACPPLVAPREAHDHHDGRALLRGRHRLPRARVQQPQDIRLDGRVGHHLPVALPLRDDPLRRVLRPSTSASSTARPSSWAAC